MKTLKKVIDQRSDEWLKLPLWIRAFAGYFIVSAFATTVILILQLFELPNVPLKIYGLVGSSNMLSISFFIYSIYILKFFVAFGLYLGKKWAPDLGIFDGVIGLILTIVLLFQPLLEYNSFIPHTLSFEALFLIPYLYILFKVRSQNEKENTRMVQSH